MRTKHNFTVSYSDVDASRHIRLCDLERYLLETAGESATTMGFGTEYILNKYNCTWVLTRLSVEMDYLPKYEDEILVETWVEGNAHMFSIRNFHIYLHKKDYDFLIGRATSVWTLLNLTTRKVEMDAYTDPAWEGKIDGMKLDMARAPRMGRIENPTTLMPHTIHYTDIDFNNHCNSCAYLRFFLNADDRLTAHYPIRFDITYAKEVHLNEHTTVQVQVMEEADKTAVQYCLLTENGEISSTCCLCTPQKN